MMGNRPIKRGRETMRLFLITLFGIVVIFNNGDAIYYPEADRYSMAWGAVKVYKDNGLWKDNILVDVIPMHSVVRCDVANDSDESISAQYLKAGYNRVAIKRMK